MTPVVLSLLAAGVPLAVLGLLLLAARISVAGGLGWALGLYFVPSTLLTLALLHAVSGEHATAVKVAAWGGASFGFFLACGMAHLRAVRERTPPSVAQRARARVEREQQV